MKHNLYQGVDMRLLNPSILSLMNEKIRLFAKSSLSATDLVETTGLLLRYDLKETADNCAGYCDFKKSVIAYKSGGFKTLTHEMSHALQAELEIFEFKNERPLLSDMVFIEQQAETMSYYMYNKMLPSKTLGASAFRAYFSTSDICFLDEWYSGYYENDLFVRENNG